MASNHQTDRIGELAKDSARDRIGVVMGEVGGRVQIKADRRRTEWESMPDNVVAPSPTEDSSRAPAIRTATAGMGRDARAQRYAGVLSSS